MSKNRRRNPRMKRAYLKATWKIPSPRNAAERQEHIRSKAIFDYQQRALYIDTMASVICGFDDGKNAPRLEALQEAAKLRGASGSLKFQHIVIRDAPEEKDTLVFNGKRECFFVRVSNGKEGLKTLRKSVMYTSREVAMARYKSKHIKWVQIKQLTGNRREPEG